MPNWKTAHSRAAKAQRRRVYEETFAFHQEHVAKLHRTGKMHKLATTGFVRRHYGR